MDTARQSDNTEARVEMIRAFCFSDSVCHPLLLELNYIRVLRWQSLIFIQSASSWKRPRGRPTSISTRQFPSLSGFKSFTFGKQRSAAGFPATAIPMQLRLRHLERGILLRKPSRRKTGCGIWASKHLQTERAVTGRARHQRRFRSTLSPTLCISHLGRTAVSKGPKSFCLRWQAAKTKFHRTPFDNRHDNATRKEYCEFFSLDGVHLH